MGFKDDALNLVTLGGHERLRLARDRYNDTYASYERTRDQLIAVEQELQKRLAELGELTIASFKLLKRSLRIISLSRDVDTTNRMLDRSSTFGRRRDSDVLQVHRLIEGYSAARSATEAVGLGSTVAAGAWSLVALVGSASTGTAIGTLSGAAATNATLAWFGGGALAAGGAGMAGGTLVLGGIALAPMIAYASWRSRSKAKQVDLETEKVKSEQIRLSAEVRTRDAQRLASVEALRVLQPEQCNLEDRFVAAKSTLFPVPFISFAVRMARRWLGLPAYSLEEMTLVIALREAANQFSDHFDVTLPAATHSRV